VFLVFNLRSGSRQNAQLRRSGSAALENSCVGIEVYHSGELFLFSWKASIHDHVFSSMHCLWRWSWDDLPQMP